MSRVFIVQRPAYFSRERRGWVNKFDLSPAKQYGQLVFLLGPGNIFQTDLAKAISTMEAALADFTEADYLMAVGDPVAIAIASMIAAKNSAGVLRLLRYDRLTFLYEEYKVDVKNAGPLSQDSTAF